VTRAPGECDAATAWAALEAPWRVCLSLAWEAYGAGTIPVGAALVDSGGSVVAEGRNRVYERDAPPGQIAHSLLAHAEINALVGLDPERRYEDHVLYTALEPCLLCVGATVMATVGRIRYAGADPYGGGDGGLVGVNPHVERVPLVLEGPRRDAFGVLASALLPTFYLRRKPAGHVVRAFEEKAPDLLAVAQAMLAAGSADMAAAGVPLPQALRELWQCVDTRRMPDRARTRVPRGAEAPPDSNPRPRHG
jgi:tRNA(Arg) A34 adenosine deaminase TadA